MVYPKWCLSVPGVGARPSTHPLDPHLLLAAEKKEVPTYKNSAVSGVPTYLLPSLRGTRHFVIIDGTNLW